MNTKLLECIITVSKERSQSRAAVKLNISQSALSQQIKKVENDIGTPLFYKERNELFLTDAGKIYINGAQGALNIYKHALRDIQKVRSRKNKEITFVYTKGLLKDLPGVLTEFRKIHPDIYINTLYGTAASAKDYLANGIADFAITATSDLSNTLLSYIPLRTTELELALPYGHPMINRFRKEGVSFECLSEDIFILPPNETVVRQLSSRIFQQNRFIPRSIREVSEIESAIELMLSGNGICFVPKFHEANNRYVAFSLVPGAVYHIVITYPKSKVISTALKDLLMILMKTYDSYIE